MNPPRKDRLPGMSQRGSEVFNCGVQRIDVVQLISEPMGPTRALPRAALYWVRRAPRKN